MEGIRKAVLKHQYDNLMMHIYCNMRMAKEHERMEHDLYDVNYWTGRLTAWKDAMDLIEHYLGREIKGNESEIFTGRDDGQA